ncbi:MAG: hypothetical protein WBD74_15380 [Candidatus Aquilonibacter sp.]
MLNRYLARVLVTSLTFGIALRAGAAPTPTPTCPPMHASPYSPRALRHIRAMLQLRLLEARRARLTLAEGLVTHRITIDQLLALPDDTEVLAKGPNDGQLKHFHVRGASTCW